MYGGRGVRGARMFKIINYKLGLWIAEVSFDFFFNCLNKKNLINYFPCLFFANCDIVYIILILKSLQKYFFINSMWV
jgi:hypothetical protein